MKKDTFFGKSTGNSPTLNSIEINWLANEGLLGRFIYKIAAFQWRRRVAQNLVLWIPCFVIYRLILTLAGSGNTKNICITNYDYRKISKFDKNGITFNVQFIKTSRQNSYIIFCIKKYSNFNSDLYFSCHSNIEFNKQIYFINIQSVELCMKINNEWNVLGECVMRV